MRKELRHVCCYGATQRAHYHSGWTPLYFMYDPKCSTTFPWCTINAPAAFAWCTIHVPAVFAWCTNHFVHKVEFSYIGWNGVHPLWLRNDDCYAGRWFVTRLFYWSTTEVASVRDKTAFNSLGPSGVIWRHGTWWALVMLMVCRPFGAKPLPGAVLTEWQFGLKRQLN